MTLVPISSNAFVTFRLNFAISNIIFSNLKEESFQWQEETRKTQIDHFDC